MEATKGHFVKLLVEPWGQQQPKETSLSESVGLSSNVGTGALYCFPGALSPMLMSLWLFITSFSLLVNDSSGGPLNSQEGTIYQRGHVVFSWGSFPDFKFMSTFSGPASDLMREKLPLLDHIPPQFLA